MQGVFLIHKILKKEGKTMVFLKEVLGDELFEQVTQKLEGNDTIKLVNAAEGAYISKEEYEKALAQVKENNDLASELETVKKEKEELQNTFDKFKYNSAYEMALVKSGAKNPKALKGLIDESKLTFDDEGLKGFDEQLEQIKADNDYLFSAPEAGGMKHGAPEKTMNGVEKRFLEKNPDLKID